MSHKVETADQLNKAMTESGKGDSEETRDWLDALDLVEAFEGLERVDELLDAVVTSARRKGAKLPFAANTAYVNTIRPEGQPQHPGIRELEQTIRRYIRWNAVAIVMRANKDLSELGGHVASFQSAATLYDTGFMHFWRAPDETHGGDLIYLQGHSSPGIYARALPRRTSHRGADRQLPSGSRRQGDFFLSASLADAGVLAVPDRVDGPRAANGDLPGALPSLSSWPRDRRYHRAQGLGLLRRRRNGRAGVARRDLARRARKTRQPDLRRQLQPATSRRAGARQRQDRSGARGGFPRRRLERHQVPVGLQLGPAARAGPFRQTAPTDGRVRRRRIPGLQVQGRRLHPQEFLRPLSRDGGDGRRLERRKDLVADARRPRSDQGLRRLQGCDRPQGPADCDPCQDRQGLRHGLGRRGADDRPSSQEDWRQCAEGVPRPLPDSYLRRRSRQGPVPAPARRQRGDEVFARAPSSARRAAAVAPAVLERRSKSRRSLLSTRC